jgi:hypothetical protein
MVLSNDAITFGTAYLNGPRATLSFGGDGAEMRITDRARAALDELLASGFAEIADPTDSTPNREHYRGKGHLGAIAKERGFNPFSDANKWTTFEKGPPHEA